MSDRARHALLAAGVCAAALLIVGLAAFQWPLARAHDANSLAGFRALAFDARIDTAANWIADAANPLPYVLFGVAFVAVALARRRPRLALAVPIVMGAASATTELLKHLGQVRYAAALGPYDQISVPSWPSGHATASMMVALCAVLVSPPLLRPLAGLLGSGLVLAVSYSILILTMHFPSDVLGGFFVAGTTMSLTLAMLWRGERWRAPLRPIAEGSAGARASALAAALAAAGLGAAVLATRIATTHVQVNDSLIAVASAIAIVATLMPAVLVVALRPRSGAQQQATRGQRRDLPRALSRTVGR
jgi:undecaprenyl-diphosphatase